MQMKSSGFTLKPLVASLQRHRFVPLYLVALGMSAGQFQAAEVTAADDSSATVSSADAAPAPATTQLDRVEVTGSAIRRVDAETAVPITILRAEQLPDLRGGHAGHDFPPLISILDAFFAGMVFQPLPIGLPLRGLGNGRFPFPAPNAVGLCLLRGRIQPSGGVWIGPFDAASGAGSIGIDDSPVLFAAIHLGLSQPGCTAQQQ